MNGRSQVWRWTVGIVGPVAVMAATSGCALAGVGVEPLSQPVRLSQLVGHWTADSRCPHTTMDLAADGSGRVRRFPIDDAPDLLQVTRTATGPVSWRQDPGLAGTDIPASVQLTLGTDGYALDYGRDGHGFVLVATVGDPDDGVACVYHRSPAQPTGGR
ncbi:hypothetical protein [Streptacidiphilus rugosus]|uniref:hypothetical protein n=1 Tax=Streptacidiphilus rugosus TaxID=405783 RepID=UPI0005604A20|nr:hypothetical protein [Streptacidiphilus rugosus]